MVGYFRLSANRFSPIRSVEKTDSKRVNSRVKLANSVFLAYMSKQGDEDLISSYKLFTDDYIRSRIVLIRDVSVMIDSDFALLYSVTTGNLNKAVKRNIRRFPPDFMFQLTKEEFDVLIFQNGISKIGRGGKRKLPYVFTE